MISDVSGPPFSHQKKTPGFQDFRENSHEKMDFYGTIEQLV